MCLFQCEHIQDFYHSILHAFSHLYCCDEDLLIHHLTETLENANNSQSVPNVFRDYMVAQELDVNSVKNSLEQREKENNYRTLMMLARMARVKIAFLNAQGL